MPLAVTQRMMQEMRLVSPAAVAVSSSALRLGESYLERRKRRVSSQQPEAAEGKARSQCIVAARVFFMHGLKKAM